MELILISNTKLKIMLDESDMRKYHIENECDCAEISTRKAIRNLLECARDRIGFNTDGEEIFVQLYTSKQGGCELFVTKCNGNHGEDKAHEEPNGATYGDAPREARRKRNSPLPDTSTSATHRSGLPEKSTAMLPQSKSGGITRLAYSFTDLSDLLKVCRILNSAGIFPESRAFADDRDGYYLLLLGEELKAYSRLDRLTFLVEYGRRENPDCLLSYIAEHGKVLCSERAIETLCQF